MVDVFSIYKGVFSMKSKNLCIGMILIIIIAIIGMVFVGCPEPEPEQKEEEAAEEAEKFFLNWQPPICLYRVRKLPLK